MADHVNVVKFIGIGHVQDKRIHGQLALVTPYMKNGDLLTYAESHENADRTCLVRDLAQVARGLIYLHSIDIIHGDLKCSNVLVSDDGIAGLADFGLSSIGDGIAQSSSSVSISPGNPRWLAPELLFPTRFETSGKHTRETDVYAFGMTALELFTNKAPLSDVPHLAVPLEVAINGMKPPYPGPTAEARGLTESLWELMERCWNRDPSERPKT
ncbi:kinase-like protein, partial [Schizopora paradoxa]